MAEIWWTSVFENSRNNVPIHHGLYCVYVPSSQIAARTVSLQAEWHAALQEPCRRLHKSDSLSQPGARWLLLLPEGMCMEELQSDGAAYAAVLCCPLHCQDTSCELRSLCASQKLSRK